MCRIAHIEHANAYLVVRNGRCCSTMLWQANEVQTALVRRQSHPTRFQNTQDTSVDGTETTRHLASFGSSSWFSPRGERDANETTPVYELVNSRSIGIRMRVPHSVHWARKRIFGVLLISAGGSGSGTMSIPSQFVPLQTGQTPCFGCGLSVA